MSEPLPPVRGLVAAKYEVVRLIGRGGMGSVWEGRHQSLGTRVAIKFIDTEHADSDEARARFVTEARAAATIQSKHAIQIFDHGLTEDGRPYIVMELLVGEALDRRIDRLGSISLVETARVIQQVCRALQRAHDAGIIHRDLKPENVFLVRSQDDEDDEIAKVLDFGIAKIKPPPGAEGLTSSTRTGAVLGTPYYMSPEQARGLRDLDHRTDLWSLGVIAYKCVTGVLPFDGESVGDLLVKICTSPLPRAAAITPGLPPAFDAWFARALEREIPRRFATATELSQALAAAAGIPSTRGPTSTPMSHASPTSFAPRALAPTLPGAAVTSAPITASTTTRKTSRSAVAAIAAAALVGGALGVTTVVKLAGTPKPSLHVPAAPSAPPTVSARANASALPPEPLPTLAPAPAPAPAPEHEHASASAHAPEHEPEHEHAPASRPHMAAPKPSASPHATARPPSSPADPGY
jgi:serine/threonine protein kinase